MSELVILTPKQLAKRLQVPISWVYKHTDNSRANGQRLPVLRCGEYLRFDWQAVVEWLRNGVHTRSQPIEVKRLKSPPLNK